MLGRYRGSTTWAFEREDQWTVHEEGCTFARTWRFKHQCVWCPDGVEWRPRHRGAGKDTEETDDDNEELDSVPPECRMGTLLAGKFNDDHDAQTIDGRDLAMRRSYSTAHKPDAIKFMTVFAHCQFFDQDSSSTSNTWIRSLQRVPYEQPGRLFFPNVAAGDDDAAAVFEFRVNPRLRVPARDRGEDVVCGRAVYGDMHPETLVRFTKYYTEAWELTRVIVYEVGLSRVWWERDPRLGELFRSGALVVVDLRDALQELYGAMASDVALFSTGSAQMLVKADCVSRAKAARARWTFHVDFDEILVQGLDSAERRMRWPDVVAEPPHHAHAHALRVVSFGSLPVTDSTFCECDNKFNYRDWIAKIRDYHRTVEWASPPPTASPTSPRHGDRAKDEYPLPWRGPFECSEQSWTDTTSCPGASGRRKLALRVDKAPPRPFGLGVHEMSSCAYGSSGGDVLRQTSHHWSARVAYLRHYRCMNFAEFCGHHPAAAGAAVKNGSTLVAGTSSSSASLYGTTRPWFGPASPIAKRHSGAGWERK